MTHGPLLHLEKKAQIVDACLHVLLQQGLHAGLPYLRLHVPLHCV